jgi:crossover junction endodeoxyribonuclease RuvC
MTNHVRIVGFDPSLTSTGIACLQFDGETTSFVGGEVIRPVRQGKRLVRKKSDDADRVEQIIRRTDELLTLWNPQVAALEEAPCLRGAAATRKVAQVWGALFSLVVKRRCITFDYDPQTVKAKTTGRKNASKEEMVQYVGERFPLLLTVDCPPSLRHNAADAVAIAYIASQEGAVSSILQTVALMGRAQ